MENKTIHIGQQIKLKLKEGCHTVVWLAGQLPCSRTNIYKILDKECVDTKLLNRISEILEFDFFSLYSESIRIKKAEKKS